MKVLLVWPCTGNIELNSLLPLGLGYLAANLPKKYNVEMCDAVLDRLSIVQIMDKVSHIKPDVIGVSVWNFNLISAREIINIIKKKFPQITVVVGGPAPSGHQANIFESINADYAFVGEAEGSFSQFLQYFENDCLTFENKKKIEGLIYKDADRNVVFNAPKWKELEKIKYCDYEFINLNKYLKKGYNYGLHFGANRTAPIAITRGCPFSCAYCSASLVNGRKVRMRQIDSVISEIKELYEKYNINGFNIIDDNFTFDISYSKKIILSIIKAGFKNISFNSPNGIRVEYLDKELLNLMKEAGWRCIFIAPESGSLRTLKKMHKNIDLYMVKEKIKLIKDAGIKLFGFFMIGYPGETVRDIKDTIRFACENDFDFSVFTCFQPIYGTPAYAELISSGELNRTPEGFDYYKVSYTPNGISFNEIKFWRFWGLFRFYTSSFRRFRNVLSGYSLKRIFIFIFKIIS